MGSAADSTCLIGQKATHRGPTSGNGTGHTAKTRAADAHRQPDIGQRPTVGLVCHRLYVKE